MKKYTVDFDFYSLVINVSAKTKAEAKKKAKAQLARRIKSAINHIYVDEL